MQVKISGRNFKITPPIRDYIHEKIDKLEEFFSNIQKVEVVLEAHAIDNVEKRQVTEIRAWMAGKRVIQAREAGRDAYAAFDMALAEAERQVEKHKEKLGHEKRRQAKKFKLISRKKIPGIMTNLQTGP